ncbi:MAG: HAD family phosphatase [Candidatus Diapherotrites archaeon]|nr:HAD family phosphatase [Candidatus Diapherotrites archaeon]
MIIKTIVFDLGGVYFQWSHHTWFHKAGKLLKIDGKLFREAYVAECSKAHKGHITAQEHLKRMSKFIEQETGKKIAPTKMYKTMFNFFKPMKKMWSLAKKLKKNGYTIALFSNHTSMIHDLNKKWKFFEHFHYPIVSVDVGMEKPEQKFYRYLIKQVKCKPKEIVFIDDIEVNVTAGRKVGIHCIQFTGNFEYLLKELKKLDVNIA